VSAPELNQASNTVLQGGSRAEVVLPIADDELILGWRNSEWTGIAPFLEEDVAFSSIAQNEIGHARALYQLVAEELGTTADELAFDRRPEEYQCSPFVEMRLVPDWAKTIARHCLYEDADERRIKALMESDDAAVAGLAAKIDREEAYHRMHSKMWFDRLHEEPRFLEALEELRPHVDERGDHLPEFEQLWEEMTEVRRSVAGAAW
jgi:phenylacetate-CoA oxygenase PaaI subunit